MNGPTQLAGIGYGLLAYLIWGCFPLYFRQLDGVPPMDILSNRTAWAFVFVALLLTLRGRWRTAASLGYFLTPLVNVLLGLLVLKERLNRREWLAIALAALAVGNELWSLGTLPWISLFLAATFGVYGLLRKQVPIDAISGLGLETLTLLPICLVYALWQGQQGHAVFTLAASPATLWLIGAGVLTALPLMAFAAATQRLDLATVGMLMYINPTMQFLTAVFLFDEPLQPARLVSFGLIWLGLLLFSSSMLQKVRRTTSIPATRQDPEA